MTITPVDTGPDQVSRTVEVHAPAAELFALVADPRRHQELDGSGTVGAGVSGPRQLAPGARFSTKMRLWGLRYRLTSTVTAVERDRLVEWSHPAGHHWRWEFAAISPTITRVTETFDYRDTGPVKDRLHFYERTGLAKRNAAGIEATLAKLRDRYTRRT
ncbi:dimethyladenosine transferase [Mycobacterium kyorinense]|uniref:Dimethyladenosine transferase n=1 Tax=Mycobacterium kyorinense TaxID=487514 RepID=A0A1A2Z8F0_9MYCO|nr:SRPBCC family protein [Mycobacterium kyorinense]OBI45928.1 dimethyladenosine transferase [Mycobacterium kyorinense]